MIFWHSPRFWHQSITSEAPDRNQRISRPTCQNQTLLDGLSKCLFSSRWLNICLHRSHPSRVAAHPGGRPHRGLPRLQEGSRGPWHAESVGLFFFESCQNLTGSSCNCIWIKCVVVFWVKYMWTLVLHLCIHIEDERHFCIYLYAFLIPYNLTPQERMVK